MKTLGRVTWLAIMAAGCGEAQPPGNSDVVDTDAGTAMDAGPTRPYWTSVSINDGIVCGVDDGFGVHCWGRIYIRESDWRERLQNVESTPARHVRLTAFHVWRERPDGTVEYLYKESAPYPLPDAPARVAEGRWRFACAWFGGDTIECAANLRETFRTVNLVPGRPDPIDIEATAWHACYLDADGDIHCWSTEPLPHRFSLPRFSEIEFSGGLFCGIRADNQHLFCWSRNRAPDHDWVPPALHDQPVSGLWASEDAFCAVRAADDRLSCFGGYRYSAFEQPIEDVISAGRPVVIADPGVREASIRERSFTPICVVYEDGALECTGGDIPEALEVPELTDP